MTETTTLLEWLHQPPTIVIYQPNGQLSLARFPGEIEQDGVVCFPSMNEAQQYLSFTAMEAKRKGLKGFRAVNLSLNQWMDALRGEAEKGCTHLAIFHLPGDGSFEILSISIASVFAGMEIARKAIEDDYQTEESWRWN